MGQCMHCVHHNATTLWCSRLQTKKLADDGCREFTAVEGKAIVPESVDLATLDALVDWMRRRAVVAIKHHDVAITLATIEEPAPTPVRARSTQPEDPEKRRERERAERSVTFYGTARNREE